jgi:zinc metalloprotease ZmpB
MKTLYKPDLKAHVSVDAANRVRHIRHSQEYWASEDDVPRLSAQGYLHEWADTLQIPKAQLANLSKRVSFLDPREQDVEYHLNEEKHLFDGTTVGYYQTYLNTPVWRKGLSVKIKQNPNRVVGSTNNSEQGLKGQLPDRKLIDRYAAVFRQAAARQALVAAGFADIGERGEAEASDIIRKIIGAPAPAPAAKKGAKRGAKAARADGAAQLLSGKFFIYKYDPKKRYAGKPTPASDRKGGAVGEERELPLLDVPPVSDKIRAGQAYLVGELIFRLGKLVWLILVEVETGSVLYIECMTCGINGLVFKRDPMNSSGDLTVTSNQPNSVLDDHDFDELLPDLDPPSGGLEHLSGLYVTISEQDAPVIAAPTVAAGSDFDFNPRTNDFGAVNAYYHQTQLFRTIASLGFVVEDYFDGTTFPIPVDHRASISDPNGEEINAFWSPNGTGGTGFMGYCLCDTTDVGNPLGRAVDPYVHWHEMGGHGVLGDHVGSGNLGFSHSHGDGLAAIQNDPESGLRALPERFRYAPFRPFTTERRFDRPVNGWAWNGGFNDDGGYGSEQILATCHFRLYRSIGGDAANLGRRQFASRVATYLILRTTANLTAATNPQTSEEWCDEMQVTDLENWTSEGLSGGAYNKVIRWAFEMQGSYQPPGAPTPVTTVGAPPEVDVYIDDGRAGEYPYIHAHWQNQSMWNRNAPDGLPGHQNAIDGQTNYMYCKVKNRGTSAANNVTVRGYHTLPGAGLTWPTDFTEMGPAGGLPIASVAANNAGEETAGPFEWEPNINAYGHDCVLMIASVAGDPSNVDNFTAGETVQEWRLVPHDNNVGQRNVSVVPGAGGCKALMASLDGAFFMAGNNLNKKAKMELQAKIPAVLAAKGWKLKFVDIPTNKFVLGAGQKRKVCLDLQAGTDFTKADIVGAADRQITVELLANGILLGGMSYYIDPNLSKPSGGKQPCGKDCDDVAKKLLDCLKVGCDTKVKKVRVKKVSVDIELHDDCDRDCGGGCDCD